MPYIPKADRAFLDQGAPAVRVGELNYALTRAAIDYLDAHGLTYQTLNDVVGAFECAKQEFYRRVVVPYEQDKIEHNGDVYDE